MKSNLAYLFPVEPYFVPKIRTGRAAIADATNQRRIPMLTDSQVMLIKESLRSLLATAKRFDHLEYAKGMAKGHQDALDLIDQAAAMTAIILRSEDLTT
jgi:hypothetical protein